MTIQSDPDRPDTRRFIEPVDFTNDRLSFLNATGEAYVITDDGGNVFGILLSYDDAVRAHNKESP